MVTAADVDDVGVALNVVARAGCCGRCAGCGGFCACDTGIEASSPHAVTAVDAAMTTSIQCNRLRCGLCAVLCRAGIVILRRHAERRVKIAIVCVAIVKREATKEMPGERRKKCRGAQKEMQKDACKGT